MVEINLIPVALRKKGKGSGSSLSLNIPYEILLGVGSGVVLLLVTIHLILGVWWMMGNGHLSLSKEQWQKVLPDKTQMDSMNQESGDLNGKIKTLAEMTTKKFLQWSFKFNVISDDLPKGLWIRRMTLDKAALTIEGSVVSKTQNEINNVGLFVSVLKKKSDFMKDFSSVEVNSIQRGRNNAVDVTDFTVMAKLNEQPKLK